MDLIALAESGSVKLGADGVPTEFRLFSLGTNKTSRGDLILDEPGMKQIMQAFREKGLARIAIDYEHQTYATAHNGQPAPASGSYVPEPRADGIWATDVKWTDRAKQMLLSGEYFHFSPTVKIDAKGRIVRLMVAALTNDPATHGQEALIAASESMTICLAVWSTAFINNLDDSAFLYVESGGTKDGEGKTTPRSLRHFPVRGPDGSVDMPHLRNALSRIPQSSLPAAVKAEAIAKAKKLMPNDSTTMTTETKHMQNLPALIGLKDDAPEGDIEGRVIALSRTEARLLEVTGATDVADAIGSIIKAKDAADRLAVAEKELQEWQEHAATEQKASQSKAIGELVQFALSCKRTSATKEKFVQMLTEHGEAHGVEKLKSLVDSFPDKVRVYQAPPPANTDAARDAALSEWKAAHPGASTRDAFVALAAERPALFPEYTNGGR